jgi:hypothetical protein
LKVKWSEFQSGLFVAGFGVAAGCAANVAPNAEGDAVALAMALSVVDCQTIAAECLGVMPTLETVRTCRDGVRACLAEVADGVAEQATGVTACRDAAVECGTQATGFADASMCRAEFEACASDVIDLPALPTAPMLPLPTLPPTGGMASGPGTVIGGAGQCRQDALACVQDAAGDVVATATCAEGFRQCVGDALAGGASPSLPGGRDASASPGCRDEALACVQGANTRDEVQACGEGFAACVGLDPSSVPSPGAARPAVPDPGCLDGLRECVLAGTNPSECIDHARICAGI